jgi:hypothetical protein
MALMTSLIRRSSTTPIGPRSRSITSDFSIESMFSHWATQSAVRPNSPAWNGTQLGSVRLMANRADVQTTARIYRPRFRLSRDTTMMGCRPATSKSAM